MILRPGNIGRRSKQRGMFGISHSVLSPAVAAAAAGAISPFWPTTCYSMRLRNSAYAGSCIRVRNGTTNVQTDIGFKTDGWVDDVALAATRTGAEDVFVVTWYDQSGSGKHATNATAGTQPRVYAASVLDAISGHPAIRWHTGGSFLAVADDALFGFGTGAFTVDIWGWPTTIDAGTYNTAVDLRSGAGAGYQFFMVSNTKKVAYYNGTVYGNAGTSVADGALQHFEWDSPGGTGNLLQFLDGVQQSSTSLTLNGLSSRPLLLGNSKEDNSSEWPGLMGEVLICKGTAQHSAGFTPRSYT